MMAKKTKEEAKKNPTTVESDKSRKTDDKQVDSWPCPICLGCMTAESGGTLGMANPCGHWLHTSCFENLKSHLPAGDSLPMSFPKCPMCQATIEHFTRSFICDGLNLRPQTILDPNHGLVQRLREASTAEAANTVLKEMSMLVWKKYTDMEEENRNILGQAGAVDAATAAMESFPGDLEVQTNCSCVLAGLVCDNEMNKKAAVEAKVIPSLIKAMGLCNLACRTNAAHALRNLLCSSEVERRKIFVSEGGLKQLVSVMKKRATDAKFQEHGVVIICNLGSSKALWGHLVENECLSVAAAVADYHRHYPETKKWALEAAYKCILALRSV
jgi:hypothetical protein